MLDQWTAWSQQAQTAATVLQGITDIDVGSAPKNLVYQQDKIRLYQYSATATSKKTRPTLIVYALVNKYYIMDLDENHSIIQRLLAHGENLYLIDWGYPDPADRMLDFDDYINGYLADCVAQVCQHTGFESINILGVCQGGTISLCYTALHPATIANIITMVTPVDFSKGNNILRQQAQHIDAQQAVAALGNISGNILNQTFATFNPITMNGVKQLQAVAKLQTVASAMFFLRMDKWLHDSPAQTGTMFRQFIMAMYQQNLLIQGRLTIDNVIVDLSNISQPVLNIYGHADRIVPPASSTALQTAVSSKDYTEVGFAAGHIGIYVSHKCLQAVPATIHEWLHQHQ